MAQSNVHPLLPICEKPKIISIRFRIADKTRTSRMIDDHSPIFLRLLEYFRELANIEFYLLQGPLH